MRALVVDHSTPGGLAFAEVPEPVPAPNEALIEVKAISLNPGELSYLLPAAADGDIIGWDAAGVVVRAAADGSGPAVGTPVTSLKWTGAWAGLRTAETRWIGTLPAGADFGLAATIPVAAGSALSGLRRFGSLLGRRVMVTGATGAVGRFAVQLARRAGARVVAVARSSASEKELRALGADEVVSTPSEYEGFVDGVIDTIGGPTLVEAYTHLATGGVLVAVGGASGQPIELAFDTLSGNPEIPYRRMESFILVGEQDLAADLTWLAHEIGAGRLVSDVDTRADWSRAPEFAAAFARGERIGKVVLDVA